MKWGDAMHMRGTNTERCHFPNRHEGIALKTVRNLTLAAALAVTATSVAKAQTVTINFDAFADGQVLGRVGDVGFYGNVTVFRPIGIATQSGSQAARTPNWCEAPECQNNASTMSIFFSNRTASSVSVRVGTEAPPYLFCFPEGTDCAVYARMVGLAVNNVVVTSSDVKLYDGLVPIAPITTELRVDDPYSRITGVRIYVGKGTFSHDTGNPGRAQIDDLRVTFGSATTPPPTANPTLTLNEPTSPVAYPYKVKVSGSFTAPAGLHAICARVNDLVPQYAPACINNVTVGNGTFSAQFDRGELPPTGNVVNVGLIDLAGRRTSTSRPFQVNPPPPPKVSFSIPSPGTWVPDPSRGVLVTGTTWVTGAPAGFCLAVTQPPAVPSTPLVAQCQDQRLLTGNGYGHAGFGNVSLNAGLFQPGQNEITAFIFDAFGQIGKASLRGTVPPDLRVTAVEVTQGSQHWGAHVATGPYQGTTLTSGVPTVVRVFANSVAGGPFSVRAKLLGMRPKLSGNGGWESLGLLFPDNGTRSLATGTAIPTLDQRADANGAFVFTLPIDWTTTSGLRIRAVVNPKDLSGAMQECATCMGNNEMEVSEINFKRPPASQTISPVMIRWTDGAGALMEPPSPQVTFSDFRALAPLPAASLVIRPYVTIIDASRALLSGVVVRPNGIDSSGGCDDACKFELFSLVANFEISNQEGFTIGITSADVRGHTAPVFYPRFIPPFFFAIESLAVASTTAPAPALRLSVAHELMHQWGYLHASGECGAGSQLSVSWPPDYRGRLQGIGLDRRQGSGPTPGTYTVIVDRAPPNDAYDIMSYCARGMPNWISPPYWEVFGNTFTTGGVCIYGNCRFSSAPPEYKPSMRVLATRNDDGRWRIHSVHRFRMPYPSIPVTLPDAKTGIEVIARDPRGRVIGRSNALVAQGYDSADWQVLSAALPVTDAAEIVILERGRELARRKASARPPSLQLEDPTGTVGESDGQVQVRWKAGDADGDSVSLRIDYSHDDGSTWNSIGITASPDGMSLPRRLFPKSERARLRVTASDGFHETTVTSQAFRSAGAPPEVYIMEPSQDLLALSTSTLNLQASAFDDHGKPVAHMSWFVDGEPLGKGPSALLLRPKPGRHIVMVVARDGHGRTSKAERTVIVENAGY